MTRLRGKIDANAVRHYCHLYKAARLYKVALRCKYCREVIVGSMERQFGRTGMPPSAILLARNVRGR
jgi:hypothetical protein